MLDLTASRLTELLSDLQPLDITILKERMWLLEKPRALEDIGRTYGITRERVRQRQAEIKRKVESCFDSGFLLTVGELKRHLDIVDSVQVAHDLVNQAVPYTSSEVKRILSHALFERAGYKYVNGALIHPRAQSFIRTLERMVKENVDSYGLMKYQKFLSFIPDDDLNRHVDWFIDACRFHKIFDMIALRLSRNAKLQAALLHFGRPTTRLKLAESVGLTNKMASAALSSMSDVIRVSRTEWALRKWGLHEYRGIVNEIVDYIERHDGSATLEDLINSLSNTFDVKKWSVRAYAQTAKFSIQKGKISLATQTFRSMKPLDEVVHGFDANGLPYWTFIVQERYFRGYSVVGVPFEVASFLGCPPDGATELTIRNLPNARNLTVQWYLTSTTRASIGYIREALEALSLQEGQWARITLVGEKMVDMNWHPAPTDE